MVFNNVSLIQSVIFIKGNENIYQKNKTGGTDET